MAEGREKKAGVLIPAFEEASAVRRVVEGARRHVSEVVVVDDGSRDETAAEAKRGGAVVLRHESNRGKGEALKTGFRHAMEKGWEAVVIVDADGQHDPEAIPLFLEVWRETGAGVVVGDRMSDTESMPWIRYMTNRFTSYVLSWMAGCRVPDSQCGYRLIAREVFSSFRLSTSRYDTESEIIIRAGRMGARIVSVAIPTVYGEEKSKIHPLRDSLRFFRLVGGCLLAGRRGEGR